MLGPRGDSTSAGFAATHRLVGLEGLTISGASNSGSERKAAVSLLFSRGKRPSAYDVQQLADTEAEFSVILQTGVAASGDLGTGDAPVWLELLANGLSFDLVGLAPGPPATMPPRGRTLGLDDEDVYILEAVTLVPGPHLAGGMGLTPVVRMLASVGASLAGLEGARAVCWHSSRGWSEPSLYREGVSRWVDGGVFPALTLAGLSLSPDGGMHSEGLALFTGQELRLEPEMVDSPAEAAKLAVRLLDHLVERGTLRGRETLAGPDGSRLALEPSPNGQFVRVWRS